ncbi:MAG: DUF4157 domain-containing protein [Chloroflexi bacterium]|nr:DUF4157 domain-containing protein [Chloroflexota bacterium]
MGPVEATPLKTAPESRLAPEAEAAVLSDPRFNASANLHPKAEVLLGLQGSRGNSYVQRRLAPAAGRPAGQYQHLPDSLAQQIEAARGNGEPLDRRTRETQEEVQGADLREVRVHTGPPANRLAAALDAEAFTTGSDVFFGSGAYAPGSPRGREILGHELAHVVQQRQGRVGGEPATVRPAGEGLEQEAAELGRHLAAPAAPARGPAPRHGTAAMAGDGRTSPIQRLEAAHHEHAERFGLTTTSDTGERGGLTEAEAGAVYFGNWQRDFNQAFGNNPLRGLLGDDLLFEIINLLAINKFGRDLDPEAFGVYSPREHIDNPAGQINADLLMGPAAPTIQGQTVERPAEDISSPEAIAALFQVNAAGLPAYLGRSIQYVEEEFSTAADLGRTPDGLMHFGNGLHTVEDLFAHSNWGEIAVSKLITDGALTFSPELMEELDARQQGSPDFIETLAGQTEGGIPILTTGSFVTDDTFESIKEEISNFLREFDPFSPANPERSRQFMTMALERYERLSESGAAGQIVVPFLRNLGTALTEKLAAKAREAIAGEQTGGGGLLETVRGVAGEAVGAGLELAGGALGTEWVQDAIASGINLVGELPLTDLYSFAADGRGAVRDFFDNLDQQLQRIPIYGEEIRPWVRARMEELRELIREPIRQAVGWLADYVQEQLVEASAAGTNIEEQIRGHIGNIANPTAREQLQNASTPDRIAMLSNPQFMAAAQMDPMDRDRLVAMLSLPDWARAGPSHTQIAKDHADSPFFGVAFFLAQSVDRELRDLLMAVWDVEGVNVVEPELEEEYEGEIPPEIAGRRAPPGTPEEEMTTEERLAEREAAEEAPHYREIRSREEAERIMEEGGVPEREEHGGEGLRHGVAAALRAAAFVAQEIPDGLRSLAGRVQAAAPGAAAELRDAADALPAGLESLAEGLEHAGIPELAGLAERARELAREKEGLIERTQAALRRAAAAVEEASDELEDAAEQIRAAADAVGPTMRRVSETLREVAPHIEEFAGAAMRGQEQIERVHETVVETSEWTSESHARGDTPERAALFTRVHEVMNHPYQGDWWHERLLGWCEAHRDRLEAYIRARNSGEMHVHGH